jgi:protein involved in polysaccharide export with SLBB domain
MSIKKSFMFATTIALSGLISLAQTPASQTPASKIPSGQTPPGEVRPRQTSTNKTGAQKNTKTDTASTAGASSTVTPAESDDLGIKDVMRKFRETYRLGPGDELSIKVLKQPDYSLDKVKVSPVGSIFHNLLGEMDVAGMTVDQLKQRLTTEFSEYVIDPVVYIELNEAHSAKIGVIGEIARPGIIIMTRPMTVLDAINEAGGITDLGKKSAVTVLRQPTDGNSQLIEVNVKRILEAKAKPEENIALQAGDTVIVHGNTFKTLGKISTVTGFATLLTFISRGGR